MVNAKELLELCLIEKINLYHSESHGETHYENFLDMFGFFSNYMNNYLVTTMIV